MKSRLTQLSLLPLAAALVLSMFSSRASAEIPVFEARLNDPSSIQSRNGAKLGEDRSGVSGKPGDKSYSADLSSYTGGAGPVAIPTVPVVSLEDINELTITGWYKARGDQKDGTTLFNLINTQLLWDPNANAWVWRIGTKPIDPTAKIAYWFKAGPPAPLGKWIIPDQWVYIAMVWKKADNSVEFFQGSPSLPTASAGKKIVRKEEVNALVEPATAKRTIGNDASKTDRSFDGNIDNLRAFTKALDLKMLEKIRQSDVKGEALPLP